VPEVDAANQYLLQSFNGPNGPDVVTLFTEHAASQPGGAASWKGNHGGAGWRSQHMPLIFSGYGVRQHYVSNYPAPLIDIAPTLLWLMGIPSTGMEGKALVDAIKWQSPAWAQQAQTAQGKLLWPLVGAMKAESTAEAARH
jgi:arylsulfatase A-like enzyme